MKSCRLCKNPFRGRTDKIFCSLKCKSSYHHQLRGVTKSATKDIDTILHRNRSILLEILSKHKTQIRVPITVLEKKKFNFNYITKYYINSRGKTYNYVYDFAWMTFSTNEVLIYRKKNESFKTK